MANKISKNDAIKLIDLLKEFEKLCEDRDVKFKDYAPEQIMEFLQMYRNYRAGIIDPPPF